MDRLKNIRDRFDDYGIDGLLVNSSDNRRYLSGFTGTAGSLVISRDQAVLATDFRYIEQATTQSPDFRVLRICLLYTSPSPRDATLSRMPSSA